MAASLRRALPLLLVLFALVADAQIVPGVMIFGDSVVDAGNNNGLATLVRANFPPYGRDFVGHAPTGRFCNGKLATDFTVETLGFTAYPPAYLGQEAHGRRLLQGANFASASSGYLETTAGLYGSVSLQRQLGNYREYRTKVANITSPSAAAALFSGSIYLLSAGSSDYVQNYYVNPILNRAYTPDQFSDLLIRSFNSFVDNLYGLGARKIGVTSLPPTGCLPASMALFSGSSVSGCVESLNVDAVAFNKKLNVASQQLKKQHSDLKLVVFDIYNPLMDLIKNPSKSGFFEARKGCCGSGTIETSLLCNSRTPGTCANATGYVFWDSFHPTEAANRVLADALIVQGIGLL